MTLEDMLSEISQELLYFYEVPKTVKFIDRKSNNTYHGWGRGNRELLFKEYTSSV